MPDYKTAKNGGNKEEIPPTCAAFLKLPSQYMSVNYTIQYVVHPSLPHPRTIFLTLPVRC